MNAIDKVLRMAGLVGCNVETLRSVTAKYADARRARRGAKRAHTLATEFAATLLGSHEGAWNYATWAQNLVDTQSVEG
jgi:hypothetical protein